MFLTAGYGVFFLQVASKPICLASWGPSSFSCWKYTYKVRLPLTYLTLENFVRHIFPPLARSHSSTAVHCRGPAVQCRVHTEDKVGSARPRLFWSQAREHFWHRFKFYNFFLIKGKNAQLCFLDRNYLVIQVSWRHVGHHRSIIKVHFSGLSVGSPLKAIFLLATSSFGRKSCHQSEVQTSANITSCQFYDLSFCWPGSSTLWLCFDDLRSSKPGKGLLSTCLNGKLP